MAFFQNSVINKYMQNSARQVELKPKIDTTDKEIDQNVYKLYELTDDEIKIVEGH
jgi:type II restriction/modification system DNA methylase subunit YeeA